MNDLVAPRYRIEYRDPELSALIVDFADTLVIAHLTVAHHRDDGLRGARGDLVIVNQDYETDVKTFPLIAT